MYATEDTSYATAFQSPIRYMRGEITLGEDSTNEVCPITDETDLCSITIERGTQSTGKIIGNAYSSKCTVVLLNRNAQYAQSVGQPLTCYLWEDNDENEEPKKVPFPKMTVDEVKRDDLGGTVTLIAYDALYWATGKIENISAPSEEYTMGQYLSLICEKTGIQLSNNSFYKSDMTLKGPPNFQGNETYRDAIAAVAEAALGNAIINRNGELEIKSVVYSDEASPVIEISPDLYTELTLEPIYGPVNSLVLARLPQEDNALETDVTSINEHGLCEFIISDNPFIDYPAPQNLDEGSETLTEGDAAEEIENGWDERRRYLDDAFIQLNGFTLCPFTMEWRGNPALDCGDLIRLIDRAGNVYLTLYGGEKLVFNGSLQSSAQTYTYDPQESQKKPGVSVAEAQKQTTLAIDKVNQKIDGFISRIDEAGSSISQLKMEVDNLTSTISTVQSNQENEMETSSVLSQTLNDFQFKFESQGGQNLLRNSCGQNKLESWDEDAVGVQVYTAADISEASVSGSGFRMYGESARFSQTFSTAPKTIYAYYFKYKLVSQEPNVNTSVVIQDKGVVTSQDGTETQNTTVIANIELDASEQGQWKTALGNFESIGNHTQLLFTSVNQDFIFTDLIIAKGGYIGQWTPAYGEILTSGMVINDQGIRLYNESQYEALMTNRATTFSASGKTLAKFSADGTFMGETTVQEGLTVCVNQDASGKLRIIPRHDGVFFVVND